MRKILLLITAFLFSAGAASAQYTPGLSAIAGMGFNASQTAAALDHIYWSAGADMQALISTIDLFMTPAEQKTALAELSGSFFANVLGGGLYSSARRDVLERINNHCPQGNCSNIGMWAQLSNYNIKINGDENSPGNYKDKSYGGLIGADWYSIDYGTVMGAYLKFTKNSITQQKNSADSTTVALGAYGGLVDLGNWDFTGAMSVGFSQYETRRNITFAGLIPLTIPDAEANFDAVSASLDIEGAYKMHISDALTLRPFAGAQGSGLYHGAFKESGQTIILNVYNDFMAAAALKGGAGLVFDTEKFNLYGGAELKYLLLGDTPEIRGYFPGTNTSFRVKGAQSDKTLLGLGAGAELKLGSQIRLFGNINALSAGAYSDLSWNLGFRYAFCNVAAPAQAAAPAAKKPATTQRTVSQPGGGFTVHPAVAATLPPAAQQSVQIAEPVQYQQYQAAQNMKPVVIGAPVLEIGSLYYNSDVSDLGPNAMAYLNEQAAILKRTDFTRIYLTGHTDNMEADALALSTARARIAAEYLISQGIPAHKVEYGGRGAAEPAKTNVTAQGRWLNRRVDFLVI